MGFPPGRPIVVRQKKAGKRSAVKRLPIGYAFTFHFVQASGNDKPAGSQAYDPVVVGHVIPRARYAANWLAPGFPFVGRTAQMKPHIMPAIPQQVKQADVAVVHP
nr:hypothetical protein [Paenibacillus phytorum]